MKRKPAGPPRPLDLPPFLRIPEPPIPTIPARHFSLGVAPIVRLKSEHTGGYDGFTVSLVSLMAFGAGVVFCRIAQGFF